MWHDPRVNVVAEGVVCAIVVIGATAPRGAKGGLQADSAPCICIQGCDFILGFYEGEVVEGIRVDYAKIEVTLSGAQRHDFIIGGFRRIQASFAFAIVDVALVERMSAFTAATTICIYFTYRVGVYPADSTVIAGRWSLWIRYRYITETVVKIVDGDGGIITGVRAARFIIAVTHPEPTTCDAGARAVCIVDRAAADSIARTFNIIVLHKTSVAIAIDEFIQCDATNFVLFEDVIIYALQCDVVAF